jgi:hypothetical protein
MGWAIGIAVALYLLGGFTVWLLDEDNRGWLVVTIWPLVAACTLALGCVEALMDWIDYRRAVKKLRGEVGR